MRTLNIEVTDNSVIYPDGKLAGRIGEHNATQLVIELPELLLTDIDYHIISFDTLRGSVVSDKIMTDNTKEAYLCDGSIYCTLWQELTKSPALMFTVEAYAVTDSEPVMIAKSPYIDELYFDMSADDNASEADTSGYGLACEVDILKQSSHSHSNISLLSGYTQTEAVLANAVEKSHSHENIDLLNGISESFDTKADKVTPSREGSFAGLDGGGNICDSGLTSADFLNIASAQGSGAFNTNSSLNSFTSVGRYAVSYTNTAANTEQTLFLDISNIDGIVRQYVFDRGTVFVRQLASGSWGSFAKTAFVNMCNGVTPGFGHIPIFYNSSSSFVGATVTDSGYSLNDFVQKIEGMGLSTNDFTEFYKDKLDLLDPGTYYHFGESIDLNRYYTAGLHIFHGTLESLSRPYDNDGKDLLMIVADTIRDEELESDSCIQYAFGNSTIVYRSLTVHDNGIIAVSEWTALGGDKVDKESGKGLSSNDYTDSDKALVETIPSTQKVCTELPAAANEGDVIYLKADFSTDISVSSESLVENEGEYSVTFKDGWQSSVLSPTALNYIILENTETEENINIQLVDSATIQATVSADTNAIVVQKGESTYICPLSSISALGWVAGNWYVTSDFATYTVTTQPDTDNENFCPTEIVITDFEEFDKVYQITSPVAYKTGMYKHDGVQWTRVTDYNIETVLYNGTLLPVADKTVSIEPDKYGSLSVEQGPNTKVIYPLADKEYYLTLSDDVLVVLPSAESIDGQYAHRIVLKVYCSTGIDISFCSNVLFAGGMMPDIESEHYYRIMCDYHPIAQKWLTEVSVFE